MRKNTGEILDAIFDLIAEHTRVPRNDLTTATIRVEDLGEQNGWDRIRVELTNIPKDIHTLVEASVSKSSCSSIPLALCIKEFRRPNKGEEFYPDHWDHRHISAT